MRRGWYVGWVFCVEGKRGVVRGGGRGIGEGIGVGVGR